MLEKHRSAIAFACAAWLAGCAGQSTAMPAAPAMQNAGAAWSHVVPASFVFAGRFVQQTSGGGPQAAAIEQQIAAAPGAAGRDVTAYSGVETQSGKNVLTFDASAALTTSPTRVGTNVTLVRTSAQSSDVAVTTAYKAGNGTFDQVPQVPQSRWSETASRVQRIANSYAGSSVDDTYNADGSYAETSVPVEGLKASAESYPDGNAVYQWPFGGYTQNSSISFSPPQHKKLNILFVDASQHVTSRITMGVWYPTTPPVLASDTFFNAGLVDIPASCGVAKRFGNTAYEIEETATRLDVVFGVLDTYDRAIYVSPAYGLVCLDVNDTFATYYNYTAFALSVKPLTTTTTQEELGLQQETASKTAIEESAALPLDAQLDLWRGAQRSQASIAIYRSLEHLRGKH